MTTLIVIAKECIPGRVKTRLHPPLSLEQAAELASASLADTLDALAALPATRRILCFDGNRPPCGSEDYDVIPQTDGTLDQRLGAAFDTCSGPTVLVGMDTPQLTADLLAPVFGGWPADADAWLGLADDGGYWALALRRPDGDLIRGVPMSRSETGARQLERLRESGLGVRMLSPLTDVDTIADARNVAARAPRTRFAAALRRMEPDLSAHAERESA